MGKKFDYTHSYLDKLIENRSKSNTIAAFVTLLAIVGFVAPLVFGKFLPEGVNETTASLLVGVIVLVVGDRFIDIFRAREHKEDIAVLLKEIQTPKMSLVCQHMGTYEEAWEYVGVKLKHAYAVKDVTIVHGIADKEIELFFYKKDDATRLSTVIADFSK